MIESLVYLTKQGRMLGAALICFLILSLAEHSWARCDEGEEELKFSLVTAIEGHPKGEAALQFANEMNTAFQGKFCVIVYERSELANDTEVFDLLRSEDVTFAAPSAAKFFKYSKELTLFDTPFLFDSELHALAFLQTPAARAMLAALDEHGFVGLGYWSNGMYQFSANRPLVSPDDAKGLRFRVQSSSKAIVAMMDILGAEFELMPFGALVEAIESGQVDAQYNTWSNFLTSGVYKLQSSATETNHGYLAYPVIVAGGFYERLSDDERSLMLDIFEIVSHERNRFAFEINQAARRSVARSGVQVRSLSDQELAAWRNSLGPILQSLRDDFGSQTIEDAIRFNRTFDPMAAE